MNPATRLLFRIGALALGVVLMASAPETRAAGPPRKARVYVGTYTDKSSKGVYRFDLDLETGETTAPVLAAPMRNPTFLALDASQTHLYAVGEVESVKGKRGGFVSAFAIDRKTGDLTFLNTESTVGGGPCHVTVDKAAKNVLVANYGGGSVAVLSIIEGGRLGPASSFIQHQGKGANPQRQEGPHAHSINLDPANRFAFACDLGLDKVFIYRFDPEKGALTPNDPPFAQLAPGAGPRHFTFHPDGKHAYAINELDSTMTTFAYDPEKGALTDAHSVSTLPAGFKGTNYPADVHVHPNGRFVYGSNRGHDSIAVLKAAKGAPGRLELAGHQGEGVKNPRNFGIAPGSRLVLVANQDNDSIVVFRLDAKTGGLSPTGHKVRASKPVCVQFAPVTGD